MENNAFFIEKNNGWQMVGEGVKRQITGYNNGLMMVKVAFETGAVGALHSHPHTQASYVASGSFEAEIDGKKQVLNAGDCFFVQPNLIHGVVCLTAGVLIDVFNPHREDFI
ncbi:cupin domain-containing protein [Flavobacterium rhizosphaerae]|uniref:Cupin domain-containing protein n=1 Tax=Flavobacterium rhizosphaerae TaxID=3163298 RepID=A0ABW8YYW3_9FLAO